MLYPAVSRRESIIKKIRRFSTANSASRQRGLRLPRSRPSLPGREREAEGGEREGEQQKDRGRLEEGVHRGGVSVLVRELDHHELQAIKYTLKQVSPRLLLYCKLHLLNCNFIQSQQSTNTGCKLHMNTRVTRRLLARRCGPASLESLSGFALI